MAENSDIKSASDIWKQCFITLQADLPSQQFNTWIKRLKVSVSDDQIILQGPNKFVVDWVKTKYLNHISRIVQELAQNQPMTVSLQKAGDVLGSGISIPPTQTTETTNSTANIEETGQKQAANFMHEEAAQGTKDQNDVESNMVEAQMVSYMDNSNQFSNYQGATNYSQSAMNSIEDNFVNPPNYTEVIRNNNSVDNSVNISSLEPVGNVKDEALASESNEIKSIVESPVIQGELVDTIEITQIPHVEESSAQTQQNSQVNSQDRQREVQVEGGIRHNSRLQTNYTFDSFIQGNSNQMALAAARQVATNPGSDDYNPLFIYGGVGLGKTHLMQAVGHSILQRNPQAKVLYVSSERFVADMVKAMTKNAFPDFKRYYRSVDALLIDDIQFFAKKDRSQEEFFHTFNALFEGKQQIIMTSDRFPKDIEGMEDRLKSRFGWGMTIGIEPPELETRVAILKKKAATSPIILPDDAAFFIAQKIRSNVRELEGALRRVIANAEFTKRKRITVGFVKDTLKDLLASHDKTISVDNIQRTVAEYYNIKIADLTSKRRTRSVARPRQMAMSLAKELTNHSYPEIGKQFGGRDHTTVLHACRKVKELVDTTSDFREDYKNLKRTLNS